MGRYATLQQMTEYIQIQNKQRLPDVSHLKPFRAIVVIEEEVSSDWQYQTSRWLVNSGCFYMMAWGKDCSSWDDSVDFASAEINNYEEIPDESLVMTTWHKNDSIEEVIWFANHCAFHGDVEIEHSLILHISPQSRKDEILEMYRVA